jgi:transaldolase
MSSRAQQLLAIGQSVWLDFIRRRDLDDGTFAGLVRDAGVVGVTSNPTIFQQAIAGSDDYDASLQRHAAAGLSGPELFEALAIEDIQQACDQLQSVAEATHHRDGRVSIEVSPRLAHDTAGTIEEARRLHARVARRNLLVKVPATAAGLPAIEALTAEGISINVTLIFSLARYRQVMEAYLAGLEKLAARGQPLAPVFSVASFFVSRVDTKVDGAIEKRVAGIAANAPERAELEGFRGKVAVANARLAYAAFLEVFGSARFATLAAQGANRQRPLWASTGTKNPAYSDVLYVDELIGADTVNTMPPHTLAAYNDHGSLEVRITRDLDGARRAFERLPKLGVPVNELINQLEPEGVTAFVKSYDSLLETLESRRAQMVGPAR